ncbi:MAG: DUF4159 domain-containing protein [Verrucomicrobiales bacterium]
MFLLSVVFATFGSALAQRWGGEGYIPNAHLLKTARETPSHSTGTPDWTNPKGFEKDVFTFARIRYSRAQTRSWRAGNWITDLPDSDLNLSFRLQELTSIRSDPNGRILNLTDSELFDYPWIYIVEPGGLLLEDEEIGPLRKYLQNGGFMMADDFWGTPQWENFEREMKRVLPNSQFVDLPMDHPIFSSVFILKGPVRALQVPNVGTGIRSQWDNITWEEHEGEICDEMHVRAILDDKGRIMVLATHNTDNGDGWEREGENDYFFRRFSENISYPLGINIIFYAMTH